jgi:hypothetical protein
VSATITVSLNTADVARAITALKGRARPAIARALNRSAASAKTLMVSLISTDMGMKVSDVRGLVTVQNATAENLEATFRASPTRVPLYDFRAKGRYPSLGRGNGVTARLPGGAGRYPNAFIAKMPTGHMGVFQRRTGARRLPIYELRGPSIWQAFINRQDQGVARAEEQLAKNLPHELEFALTKL